MSGTNSWTQPVGGKVVTWRFLKVGDQMDLDGNFGRSDVAYLKKYAVYAARILTCGDSPKKFETTDLRDWDEYDLNAFAEEVDLRELMRASALSSKRVGNPVANLERAIEGAQIAAAKLGEELKAVLMAAKSAEQALGPLGPAAVS